MKGEVRVQEKGEEGWEGINIGREENFVCTKRAPLREGRKETGGRRGEVRRREAHPLSTPSGLSSKL